MIDARRMEVYSSLYDQFNNEVREIRADVVDENTYSDFLTEKVLFFGDGAMKCKKIINNKNAYFYDGVFPSAKEMSELINYKYANKYFEDIAYYEPYYLKDFVLGKK
jgi:tRNA threonylcarbamoyladenosine biosynthesis protein TsaB